MKKYLLGAAALVLAIGFSAFTTKTVSYLSYNQASVSLSQIEAPASYDLSVQNCTGATVVPCKIDIAPYANAVAFTNFLKTLSPANAQIEFDSRATAGFKP